MSTITIEGTVTPSTFLPTGERRKVTRTPLIDKLIKRGFVAVVAEVGERDAPTVVDTRKPEDIEPPARNATTAQWQEFLTARGVEFDDDEGRDALIGRWYGDQDTDPEP